MNNWKVQEFLSKKVAHTDSMVFTGTIDNPWEVQVDIASIKEEIQLEFFRQTPPSMAKYFPFMPVKKRASFISLQEG